MTLAARIAAGFQSVAADIKQLYSSVMTPAEKALLSDLAGAVDSTAQHADAASASAAAAESAQTDAEASEVMARAWASKMDGPVLNDGDDKFSAQYWAAQAEQKATDAADASAGVHDVMTNHTSASDPHPQYTTVERAAAAAPVQSFNNRKGVVTLQSADVVGALGFTPAVAATTLAGYGITDGQQKYKQLHINTAIDAANVDIPLELNAEYSLYTGDSHSRPLPANPEIGDKIIFYNLQNSWGNGLFTLKRGNPDHTINGLLDDVLFDSNLAKRVQLTYVWGNSWIMSIS